MTLVRPATMLAVALVGCGPHSAVGTQEGSDFTGTLTSGPVTETFTATTAMPDGTTTADVPTSGSAPDLGAMSSDTVTTGSSSSGEATAESSGGDIVRECDNFLQDCREGEKCSPWADRDGVWKGTRCVPVLGGGIAGEACTAADGGLSGIDDCAFGHMCQFVNGRGEGKCVEFCTGTSVAPACVDGFACASDLYVLWLCLRQRDPLIQDCPQGDTCIQSSSSFVCIVDASGDQGQANDPCTTANGCDPGLVCHVSEPTSAACDPETVGCCTPYCTFPNGACPNLDQTCLAWHDEGTAPPGEEDIGRCGRP